MTRRRILLFIALPLLLLLAAGAFAWPYTHSDKVPRLSEAAILPDTVILDLDLEGTLELLPGETLGLVTEARGFGFPGSSLLQTHAFVEDGSKIEHKRRGYFTKLRTSTKLTLPPNRVYKITLSKRVTGVLVPGERTSTSSFVHVQLTAPLTTPLNATSPEFKVRVIAEDFFGRKTRAFSF